MIFSSICIQKTVSKLPRKLGVHTPAYSAAAGFHYTDNGYTTRCNDCGLEITGWTTDMIPITIHNEQNPECSFIKSLKRSEMLHISTTSSTSLSIVPRIRNSLFEVERLKQIRRRTFSYWPHHPTAPHSEQMNEAGFFCCNVIDRVICIYCNLICQNWKNTDDPCEVHKTLSPNCIYVKAKLIRPAASSILIVNENSSTVISTSQSTNAVNLEPLRSQKIVFTAACNPAYAELPKRHASFATWANETLPSVDDLGANDNPMIEHARRFPHCPYAKQLCGDEMYRKIQESERAEQERARANEAKNGSGSSISNTTTNSRQLLIVDESTLSRLVAARLDLSISQRLLDKHFKLLIIKRCWQDQLRLINSSENF